MRVLLSGGEKTSNILRAIQPRFKSGVDFAIENNISNISKFINRGDYFDRAIIMEQSLTEDDSIKDEIQIRENTNKFIQAIRERFRNYEIIFVTSEESMAKIILEESIDIAVYSNVMLKKPPYFASFFTELITLDINKMPEKYIFDLKKASDNAKNEAPIDDITWSGTKEPNDSLSGPILESAKAVDIDFGEKDMDDEDCKDGDNEINNELFNGKHSSLEDNINFENVDTSREIEDDEDDKSDTFDELNSGFSDFDFDNSNGFDGFNDLDENGENTHNTEDKDINNEENTEELEAEHLEENKGASEEDSSTFNDLGDEDGTVIETESLFDESFDSGFDTNDNVGSDAFDNIGVDESTEAKELDNREADSIDSFDFDSFDFDSLGESEEELEKIESAKKQKEIDAQEKLFETPIKEDSIPLKKAEDEKPSALANDTIQEVEEEPVDFGGIKFKGIKGRGTKAKTKYKSPLNKKDILNDKELRTILNTFLKRGNALTVTGGRCSGKTLVASNLANIVAKMGYTVLLVDMDVHWRGQAYINKDVYETVHSANASNDSLRKAVNSNNSEIGRYVDIIRPGFHVLTTGIGCDVEDVSEIITAKRLSRFIHSAKSSYNFIIFDVPFEDLTTSLADILFATDDLVMCVDTSNHGLMEFMLNMTNIESEEVKDTMFGMSQILFNKVTKVESVFGYKVKTVRQVLKAIDMQVESILGGEADYLFRDMKIGNVIQFNQLFEKCWFSKYQVSDFTDGEQIFVDLMRKILVKNG